MVIEIVPSRNETRSGAGSPGTVTYLHREVQKPGSSRAGNFRVSRGFITSYKTS